MSRLSSPLNIGLAALLLMGCEAAGSPVEAAFFVEGEVAS
ncbi:hypothetical protein C4K19_3663 [Pseudomonas chlororaphis subsp. aurantiaca]|nr:hypothetical protein C4K19_3663 [Pseudomonas chlororaphis subsp. aurantiaca]AZD61519.1 hypothetical protein C4K18_3548 [Pseudomonas chlororaphis subsp. aurantiaca]